jgi:hypothetical protein
MISKYKNIKYNVVFSYNDIDGNLQISEVILNDADGTLNEDVDKMKKEVEKYLKSTQFLGTPFSRRYGHNLVIISYRIRSKELKSIYELHKQYEAEKSRIEEDAESSYVKTLHEIKYKLKAHEGEIRKCQSELDELDKAANRKGSRKLPVLKVSFDEDKRKKKSNRINTYKAIEIAFWIVLAGFVVALALY